MGKTKWFEWDGKLSFTDDEGWPLGSLSHRKHSVEWRTVDGRCGTCANEADARKELQREIERIWPLDVGL